MSRFDFNKPLDFAIATMSAQTQLLNAFARDKTEWDISEGSYKGGRKGARTILFHVFRSRTDYQAGLSRVVDTSGRRKAKFSFPYVDGQTTDDLGRKGESFDVEILFHGPTYRAGLNRLMIELNDPIPGTMEHPVRGTIRCGAEDWSLEHSADTKQAVLLHVRFTEHNFETAVFQNIMQGPPTPRSALQKLIAAIQKIAAAIAAVRQIVGVAITIVNTIKQKIAEFYNAVINIAANAAAAFGMSGGDLAAILPINQGGTLAPSTVAGQTAGGVNPAADPANFASNPSTNLTAGVGGAAIATGGFIRVSSRFTTVVSPLDPFANLPIELLGDTARQAIELKQLEASAETIRAMANEINSNCDDAIETTQDVKLASIGRAAASLQSLLQAKLSTLDACSAIATMLQTGSASGKPMIVNYTVPRTMSIREAAFANGLTPQEGTDIAILNPRLGSTNLIERGTVLRVPTFL